MTKKSGIQFWVNAMVRRLLKTFPIRFPELVKCRFFQVKTRESPSAPLGSNCKDRYQRTTHDIDGSKGFALIQETRDVRWANTAIQQVETNQVGADALDLRSPPPKNRVDDLLNMSLRMRPREFRVSSNAVVNTRTKIIGQTVNPSYEKRLDTFSKTIKWFCSYQWLS